MGILTSRTLAQSTAITPTTLIHIVTTADTSQNSAGSSYKAELGQLAGLFSADTNTYVTGFTYLNNTFTIFDNSGNTFNATINDVTGLTINGDLIVTGNTTLDGLTANTISATTFTATTIGASGNCVTDLYVSNINSCSPLHIQPFSGTGNILIGENGGVNVGINNINPTAKLDIKGSGTTSGGYGLKVLNFTGGTNLSVRNDGLVEGIGSGGSNFSFGHAAAIIGSPNVSVGSTDNNSAFRIIGAYYPQIQFVPNAYTPNFVSLTTNGSGQRLELSNAVDSGIMTWLSPKNIGINIPSSTTSLSSELEVSGKSKTTTLQVTSGATSGYVLTALDSSGNSFWQPLSSISGSSVISVTGITTSAYTATTSYSYYGVEYSGVTNIEIPNALGIEGYTLRVKDERGTAATYPITITPASGYIDNNPSVTMAINYMSLTMVARNNNWWII